MYIVQRTAQHYGVEVSQRLGLAKIQHLHVINSGKFLVGVVGNICGKKYYLEVGGQGRIGVK